MHIEHLEAAGFRNLAPLRLDLSPRWVVVRGPNAQGKTNLLEALYVVATGRSFRHAPPRELIRHGEAASRLLGIFSRQGVRHEVEARIVPNGRHFRVDGRALKQSTKLLELVNVVAFFPDDLRIIKGSPDERRRFVDRAIANHRADFVEAAMAYAGALKQRNALLKKSINLDRRLLEVYDEQLVRHGTLVQRGRQELLSELHDAIAAGFESIMGGGLSLRLKLSTGLPSDDLSDYAAAFTEALRDSFARDRARGITSVGPHRADLLVELDGRDARSFASQGQQRALVLAMKLAELRYLGGRLTSQPILLLDDVSSELDSQRTAMLFEAVASLGCQVFVSTTGAAALPIPRDAQLLEMAGGALGASS